MKPAFVHIAFFIATALGGPSAIAVSPHAWHKQKEIAAPEAFQAAATDQRFVYAITSRQVAKYDRATGQRIAISKGGAKHLNSGMLWQGKLYCAHSNYPLMPEQSEIKVLNLESMELSTLKDFGDFGGSLVWVVRPLGVPLPRT